MDRETARSLPTLHGVEPVYLVTDVDALTWIELVEQAR
jgi:hypothetical protein